MNVLSTVLPGIRDLRTPLTVGGLWSLAIWLAAPAQWAAISSSPRIAAAADVLEGLPAAYTLGAVGIGVYLVGAILSPIQNYLIVRALRWARRRGRPILLRIEGAKFSVQNSAGRLTRRLRQTFREDSEVSPSIVGDAVAGKLTEVGVPADLVYVFPSGSLVYRLNALAPQLQTSAPAQAEEFDRLRSEAEFRRGVALPLAILSALFAWDVSTYLLPLGALIFTVLLGQSFRRERAASDILANAVYLGSLKIPALERCVEHLKENPPARESPIGVWAAAIAIALKGTEEAWLGRMFAEEFRHRFGSTDPDEVDSFREHVRTSGSMNSDLLAAWRH